LLVCTVFMIPLVLYAAALFVRVGVGFVFSGPAYPDSYYYVHVAQQLAAGHGFITDYLWNLDDISRLAASGALPTAANGLWMPLAELVQVPFIAIFGATDFASSVPFWLIGALAAPLTYWIGRDAGLARLPSFLAGALVAVPAGLTPFVAQPDTFALVMVLGALSLWLCARGIAGDRRAFVLGGLTVGLATLARLDCALLGLPFALAALADVRRPHRIGLPAIAGCCTAFVLVVAPWLIHQIQVFGTPFPASGRLTWLISYDQLFSFSTPPTLDGFLSQGPLAILTTRLQGLAAEVGVFGIVPLGVVLVPFAIIGLWQLRKNRTFHPFFVYAAALFAIMALVFPILVTHGTFLHAVAAIVPYAFLSTVMGISACIGWIARRRPDWNAQSATRIFGAGAVGVAALIAVVQTSSVTHDWSRAREVQARVATGITNVLPGERFMAADPGAMHYLTGLQGVVTPTDSLDVVEDVMRQYDVRWLVLERRSIVPALEPVLLGSVRPAWLSQPVAVVETSHGAIASNGSVPEAVPDAALFAVCLAPDDSRCQ
jgi:4-amino-4-deoxy-L-arabinose transferase-like glycosyltransferase